MNTIADTNADGAREQSTSELLPKDPPSWVVRGVALLLILSAIAGLLVAALVPWPESVACRFSVVPVGPLTPIVAPTAGIVEKQWVSVGSKVNRGDPLFEFRPRELAALVDSEQTDRQPLRAPYAGTVVRVRLNSQSMAVDQGQVLCELVADDAVLEAALVLPEREMDRISIGQPVRSGCS